MKQGLIVSVVSLAIVFQGKALAELIFSGETKLNNLVAELLEASSIADSRKAFAFTRPGDGWIFISVSCQGTGTMEMNMDRTLRATGLVVQLTESNLHSEAMRQVTKGRHTIEVECKGDVRVEKLVVKT